MKTTKSGYYISKHITRYLDGFLLHVIKDITIEESSLRDAITDLEHALPTDGKLKETICRIFVKNLKEPYGMPNIRSWDVCPHSDLLRELAGMLDNIGNFLPSYSESVR